MKPEHAQAVILSCCALHNFMRTEAINAYTAPGFVDRPDASGAVVDGTWRLDPVSLADIETNAVTNHPVIATDVRNAFMGYFNGEGSLEWQDRYVNRTA